MQSPQMGHLPKSPSSPPVPKDDHLSWWATNFDQNLPAAQHRMKVGEVPPAIQEFFRELEEREAREMGIVHPSLTPLVSTSTDGILDGADLTLLVDEALLPDGE